MTSTPSIDTVFFDLGDTLISSQPPGWLPGARELLETLRNKGLRLGVISNTGQLHRDQLASRLPADFDWSQFQSDLILLSAEVGHEKPSPKIFEEAIRRAGQSANCLFCTEDLLDTLVAQEVGMRAVRVERPPHSDVGALVAALSASGLIETDSAPHQLVARALQNSIVDSSPRDSAASTKILRLMDVPPIDHDLNWLLQSLQAAISLELSTIPPYLCGWWSIQDDGHAAADAIREIVIEEMLHLGLVCNLLTTLGGTPQFDNPETLPTYPGHLPGGVRPSVRVALSALTKDVLSGTFMEIEFPESGPIAQVVGETFPTIGAFYTAIAAAFAKLPVQAITGLRQLKSSSLGLFQINSPTDAQKAISLIEQQGEGTAQSPQAVGFGGELAHYYRFAEIWHERRLKQDSDGKWKFDGDPLPFPDVFPMAEVPAAGYPESLEFDKLYTAVLMKLQAAWATGSQPQLGAAVSAMFALTSPARALMQQPLPSGMGTFGPSFKFIAPASIQSFAAPAAPANPPVLPQAIITMMAMRTHRMHHYLWHEVRNNWLFYDDPTRAAIRALGWEPPRPAQQPQAGGGRTPIFDNSSGEDFLFMHRQMIAMVDQTLGQIGDPNYPSVQGWVNLPLPDASDYPVPPAWNSGDPNLNAFLQETKSDSFFQQTMQNWERQLTDPEWLRGRSLGEVGSRIEFTIHNRMHMRWCSEVDQIRPDSDAVSSGDIDTRWDDAAYNWLGDTYSSHVHPHFWKIHGWVDARIEDWKRANGITGVIPWVGTWVGPTPAANSLAAMLPMPGHHQDAHTSDLRKLLRIVQRSGIRSRFYDRVNVPDSADSTASLSHFPPSAQVQNMAKKLPLHDDSVRTDDISASIQNLTQVADSLATSAQQMMQAMQLFMNHVSTPGTDQDTAPAVQSATINVWEDDPFSEAIPTASPTLATPIQVPVPTNTQSLKFKVVDPAPAAGLYNPGTPQFRFWEATEAITRGITFWNPLLPGGTVWSSMQAPLQIHLVAGQDFNANYSRQFGLRFYKGIVGGQDFYSAESPDVVCHELGHGILDALRPELFNAASAETAAFHEAFGDMSAILSALQIRSLRDKVLSETGGKLNVNSRLSRLAEQLGWAIRQLSPTAVDRDSLRNAANRFFYADPDSLPPSAPSSTLSSEAHSFSRVFSGAFLDALARMLSSTGTPDSDTLLTVSHDMGQLLIEGVRLAPVSANYYSQVAASMIQVGATLFQDRYRAALTTGFVQHGILSPTSATLVNAPVPQMAMAGFGDQLLSLGVQNMSYRSTGLNAPDLPTRSIKMMGVSIDVHAPQEEPLFSVVSASLCEKANPPDAEKEANSYVEDLIQRGQVDLEPLAAGIHSVTQINHDDADGDRQSSKRTHTLVQGRNGRMILKRLHFNCWCGSCRHPN